MRVDRLTCHLENILSFLYHGVFFTVLPVAVSTSVFIRELDGVIITGIDHLSDFRISYVRSISIQLDCPSDNCLRQGNCCINKIPSGHVRLLLVKKLSEHKNSCSLWTYNVRSFYLKAVLKYFPLPTKWNFKTYSCSHFYT